MDGVVEVRSGRIRGAERNGVWSFSGVPYASSTAGQRRWRPPGPPRPWPGVLECTRFRPIAPQATGVVELSLGGEPEEQSEDCLSLNVWTPGLDGGRRPVMVWVHGGSFLSGSGAGSLYRGGALARGGDVVVVTFNYRLGLLGFLSHPALAEGAEGDETWFDGREWRGFGNWGLADQIAALAWVRDNIAGFGGDPGRVTLFGESAGGMSVSALLAAPAARGLFHRAIVQSGPPHTYTVEEAATRAEKVAAHLGIACTRAGWEQVPADRLVAAVTELGQGGEAADSGLLLMPVVDGGLLPRPITEAVADGTVADVPLLVGTNRDESSFFAVGNERLRSLDEDGLRHWVRRLSTDPATVSGLIDAVREARAARGELVAPLDLWVAIATEYVFRHRSLGLADAHAGAARPGVGTFCYLFTWASPAFGGVLGSCHALEIPFVFGSIHNQAVQSFSGGGEEAFALSAAMRQAWTSFAHSGVPQLPGPTGHPGGGSPMDWPGWDPGRRPTMVFGPWPGRDEPFATVDRPRDEEVEAVGALMR